MVYFPETEQKRVLTPASEMVSPVQQKKVKKYIGSVTRKPGLRIYEVNVETLKIEPAKTDVMPVIDKTGVSTTRTILRTKPGCVYVQAMNEKNALRKAKIHIAKMSQPAKPE